MEHGSLHPLAEIPEASRTLLRGPRRGALRLLPAGISITLSVCFSPSPVRPSLPLHSWNLLPNEFLEPKSLPQALLAYQLIQGVESHSHNQKSCPESGRASGRNTLTSLFSSVNSCWYVLLAQSARNQQTREPGGAVWVLAFQDRAGQGKGGNASGGASRE